MSKVKNEVAAPTLTPEQAAQAIVEAQAAVAKLKAEKAELPGTYAAAMKRLDVPAALEAKKRLTEIDLYIGVAEVAITQAQIDQLKLSIELQRGDYDAKKAVAAEHRVKCDQGRANGLELLELEHLEVDARHAGSAANRSLQRLGGLNSGLGQRTAELERKLAALAAL